MRVGSTSGCGIGGQVYGLSIRIDLSFTALREAFSQFSLRGVSPRYLLVSPCNVEESKEILYAYAVSQGAKALPLTLATLEAVDYWDPPTQFRVLGWLVTDELPEGATIVAWDYEFPKTVALENGVVVPYEGLTKEEGNKE